MIRRKPTQQGYALITAMVVGMVALTITSAIMLRMTTSTKQVMLRDKTDTAQTLSESVLNHVLDGFAEVTARKTNATPTFSDAGIYLSAKNLAEYLNQNDFLSNSTTNNNTSTNVYNTIKISELTGSTNIPSSNNFHSYNQTDGEAFDTTSGENQTLFWDSLETQPTHSTLFWQAFHQTSTSTAMSAPSIALTGVTMTAANLENLHNKAYKLYRVVKGTMKGDVEVSIVPLATNMTTVNDTLLHTHSGTTFVNHNDVFRIRIIAYVPNIMNPQRIGRSEVIINRPVIRLDKAAEALSHAVLAGGSVNLQNFDTSAGTCAAAGTGGGSCIDTTAAGDVHTNGNLSVGPNGHIQGKVTATGTVDINGTVLPATDYQYGTGTDPRDTTNVTDRVDNEAQSRSNLDAIPIPSVDSSTTAVDSVPCVDSNPDPVYVTYTNCTVTGNIDVNNNNFIEYQGTVHVTGNIDIRGSQRCTGTVPCKIVIDGKVNVAGNGDSTYNSTQESLYIVKGGGISNYATDACLDIGGNPDAEGNFGSLFYVDNAACTTNVRGNSDFFGGIITKGSVGTVGNASPYGIQRDSDMSALRVYFEPEPAPKSQLFPALIAWKELR
ncbi:MAG TPA: polymer-forming cytoskeletal protein [Candidatus Obscuribacterales bacterium]